MQAPIVACQLGRLYNKVAVLEGLLDNTTFPESYQHIKSIKDVRELNLSENPAFQNKATKGDSFNDNVSPYICPVIGLEMNGKYRFVYYWSCGCVLSERALKAVKSKICHKCQKPFTEKDIVILNGTEEDLIIMTENMKERQAKIKAEKKLKKKHQNAEIDKSLKTDEGSSQTHKGPSTSKIIDSKQISTSTVLTKRKNKNIEIEDPDFKKTKGNYSVAKDPKATEVFKSLFTSHKSADKHIKAHWITYNPFYN